MCGIIARVGATDAVNELMVGLKNLEYRGYDSAGIAVTDGAQIDVCKTHGEIDALHSALEERSLAGSVGIGHTRWSTHGPPTHANAHPHTDDSGRVSVVHNGIINNYEALKTELQAAGHTFTSETDTEVIPHLIAAGLREGKSPEDAFRGAVEQLDGSYAIAAVVEGSTAVYATRNGSPLVLGLGEKALFLASDVPAFLEFTDRVVYVEDDDVVIVRPDGFEVTSLGGDSVDHPVETVEWDANDTSKAGYSHFMRKEIDEQPVSFRQTIEGRTADGVVDFDAIPDGMLSGIQDVVFVACGTSYHAALYGTRLFRRRGIRATAVRANEFAYDPVPLDEHSLVIAVTQSGETADTLASLRVANDTDAHTLAITNVVGSTAAREADDSIFIRAGPEIGVAATKTFSSQVGVLALLAEQIAVDADPASSMPAAIEELTQVPEAIQSVIDSTEAAHLAERYRHADAYFFVGRGVGYPVACEGALKFKEITYDHAEGFAAGELKHGPLALVTPNTVVIALFTGRNDHLTLHNVEEARSRGASVIGIGPAGTEVQAAVDEYLSIPSVHPELAGLLLNIHLQLLAYHAANLRNRAIDKPRNLAKSVTVE
ncbi:glutamine--fructose-6-phosphate transaminase (isomerizing) [Halalkalirubrum salinum]|uniref:glutamine--fructose-6-phosphate transaminase (isomerizing) n=1 Tax=Halalkalirubrum salinum TaxID=2563889 RepID=UPI0010FB3EB8|nr:glutamine--fructose-6-phosphate transaminase (isomerizing) [Halalkalirubrum salinum]